MAADNELSPEVSKIVDYLELLIAARKIGIREIERRLDASKGTLNRLFSGKISLRLQTVFEILKVLDVTPEEFFPLVYAKERSNSSKEEMLRKVQSLTLPDTPPPAVLTREEVTRIVEEVLSKLPIEMNPPKPDSPNSTPRSNRRPRPRGTPKK
jgi:transcriptional regulator with XRE-family HTH domain